MRKISISTAITAILVLGLCSMGWAEDAAAQADPVLGLAHQLDDAMRHQDAAGAMALVDVDTLFHRISDGVSAPPAFEAQFRQALPTQLRAILDIVVKTGAAQDGYYFLGIRQTDGQPHALFRILFKAGGLNYHDWVVGKDAQGRLQFQDAYIAFSGELLSQSMHRIYLQAAVAANAGLIDRLRGKDKAIIADLSKFGQIFRAMQSGKYQQVLDIYNTLPQTTQEEKNCELMRLMATEKLRKTAPEQYSAAMNDYRRLFPGDPSVDLDCLDGLFEAKQFDEARQALDHIDAFSGGDPYLLVLRGNTYSLQGGDDNFAQARQCYQKAIDAEPMLAPAYWAQVTLSLKTGQYDQTAAVLTEIQQKLHIKIKDLTAVPSYAGFVKSDAYERWIASQSGDEQPQ